MHTMKLRRLQQRPSHLEAMLDSLVTDNDWIAPGAPRVCGRSELPSVLQKLALKAEKSEGAWRSWLNKLQQYSVWVQLADSTWQRCSP